MDQHVMVRKANEFEAAASALLADGWKVTTAGIRVAAAHSQTATCAAVFERPSRKEG